MSVAAPEMPHTEHTYTSHSLKNQQRNSFLGGHGLEEEQLSGAGYMISYLDAVIEKKS
jgi:hypothetical protein